MNLSSSGEISGTPTEAGTYEAQVTATNGFPPDATEEISITVDPALTVSPGTGGPGTEVSASGAGFATRRRRRRGLCRQLCTSMFSAQSVTVQTDGTFTCSSYIPTGKNAGRDGRHNVVSIGRTSGDQAETKFTLTNGVDQPTLVLKPSSDVLGKEIVDAWGNRWSDGAWPIYECSGAA